MPPLRVSCCQPRCSGKLANGKREFATSIFTTVSADARVIAHLCQSLHCCAAPHEATAKGVGVLTHRGRHGLRCPTRALFTSVSGGIIIHNTGKPRTRRRLPCADHHADERVLLLHSSAVRGRLAGSVQGHVLDAPGRCEVRTAGGDLVHKSSSARSPLAMSSGLWPGWKVSQESTTIWRSVRPSRVFMPRPSPAPGLLHGGHG